MVLDITYPPSELTKMLESVGPHFFCQVFKEERFEGGGDDRDTASCGRYSVELSATGLGTTDIHFALPNVCTDLVITELFNADNTTKDLHKKIGSATVAVTEMRFQKLRDNYRSCMIESFDIKTGDALTEMGAFVALLRQLQSFCISHDTRHLAVLGIEEWFTDFLALVGFKRCGCERVHEGVDVLPRLCMDLPIQPSGSPTLREEDTPMYSSPFREVVNVSTAAEKKEKENTQWTANLINFGNPQYRKMGDKKEYCTHWIMRGNCAYTHVGCRYKHEIPFDKKKRYEIGVRKIPQWFKESELWYPWLQNAEGLEREDLYEYRHHHGRSTDPSILYRAYEE